MGRGNPLSFFLLSSHTLYFSLSHSSSPPTFSLFLFSCALSFSPTHTSSLFPSLSCPPLLPLSLYLLTLLLSYTLFYTHGSGGYRSFPLVIPLLISILKHVSVIISECTYLFPPPSVTFSPLSLFEWDYVCMCGWVGGISLHEYF